MATGNFGLTFSYQVNPTGGSAGTETETFSDSYNNPWTGVLPGAGANQFQVAYSDAGTLTSSSITYTLSALAGIAGGTAKVIATLKEVVIKNNAAPGSGFGLTVGPGATHGCNLLTGSVGSFVIPPGGVYTLVGPDAAGIGAVTASSTDQLKLNSGSNTVPYEIQFKGA